jgi:predicted phosphodiesterase
MRTTLLFALLGFSACGGEDNGNDPAFTDTGGTLALADCGYSVTTKVGAEPPRLATDKLGADPTPRLVHLGIVGDPKTSIVAQWRTADEETQATVIRYGVGANLTEDQLTQETTGVEFRYQSTGATRYRMHQAHVCGLTAGTTYSYQVGAPGHFSPVYTFHTAPDLAATPTAEITIGFIGDARGGYDTYSTLLGLLAQRTPDIAIFSGDAVFVGITQDEWEDFLGRGEALFATTPVVPVNGNHENNAINFYSQFAMPGDQESFGFDYGTAHVTVGNDTPADGSIQTSTDAVKADLEASEAARWKLFVSHKPMWSASFHGSNTETQAPWGALIDQHHVDLVLAGHEHEIEMTKPLRAGAVQASDADATVYITAGGAGAELYSAGSDFWTQYSESTHSAATIRIKQTQLVFEAFRPDNTVITQVGYTKTKP